MRLLAAFGAGAVLLGLVSGCGAGSPAHYTDSTDASCEKALTSIHDLDAPTTPVLAISYAIDRYVIVERLVSRFNTGSKPGQLSSDLQAHWLDPASKSLADGLDELERLRTVVHDSSDKSDAESNADKIAGLFDSAIHTGTAGVDAVYLKDNGMPACSTLFGAAALATYSPRS